MGVVTGGLEADLLVLGRQLEARRQALRAAGGAGEECQGTVVGFSAAWPEARRGLGAAGGAGETFWGRVCWGTVVGLSAGVLAADDMPLSKVIAPRPAVGKEGDGTGAEGSGSPASGIGSGSPSSGASGLPGSNTEGSGSPDVGEPQASHFLFSSIALRFSAFSTFCFLQNIKKSS